jgi:ribulose-5-phosphate 4-epimerase/fuculose-1-phosphate aldolase
MTPGAGSRKTRVRTDQIFVFDLAGTIHYHPGGDRPMQIPMEWRIHTQIHKDRPEILSVAHLHARASTLLGIAGRDIAPVVTQGWLAHGGIPTWDDPRLVVSDEVAGALSRTLGKHVACQMRGHGSVVVGETAELCLQACTFIEENAQYQIDAEALGGVKPFSHEIWEQLTAQRRGGAAGAQLLWNYWEQIAEEQAVQL